jgi:hypothetical protein
MLKNKRILMPINPWIVGLDKCFCPVLYRYAMCPVLTHLLLLLLVAMLL